MASSSNVNKTTVPAATLGKFEINDYVIYYKANNYMLESGFRLIDATSVSGNEKALCNAFRTLIPRREMNEEIYMSTKLIPGTRNGNFHARGFEKSLRKLQMQRLNMYLIHYPAAPNSRAMCTRNMHVYTQTWLAVSKMNDQSLINAIGIYDFKIKHQIQLTEVIAIGPLVYQMDWYSNYICSYSGVSQSNSVLMESMAVKHLATRYQVTTAQIVTLWTIQRGAVVIPSLANRYYIKEAIKLNLHLPEDDLKAIDLLMKNNLRSNF